MTIGMKKREMTLSHKISRDWKMNKYKYLLILPVLVYLGVVNIDEDIVHRPQSCASSSIVKPSPLFSE